MSRFVRIAVVLVFAQASPLIAQGAQLAYDFQERTRALAFDPARFFPGRPAPAISIRYLGDDYGYPVYAIAVRRGCTDNDSDEVRKTCGERLTARMVRSPYNGNPPRVRARGQRLFALLSQSQPASDAALLPLLDKAGLEWLEADIHTCPTAMAHLATGRDLRFSPAFDQVKQVEIILHADTISFEVGEYLERSRYHGWLKPGSPGAWANDFAASLEPCWKPAAALVPWQESKQ